MNSASAVLAAAAAVQSAQAQTGTQARPITRRPLDPGYAYPDQAQNGQVLVNIADGTITGETRGHVAVTISGIRYETKASAEDILSVLQQKSGENTWQHEGDAVKQRKMLTRFFLDNGVNMAWLRPVVSMTQETKAAIIADLNALSEL